MSKIILCDKCRTTEGDLYHSHLGKDEDLCKFHKEKTGDRSGWILIKEQKIVKKESEFKSCGNCKKITFIMFSDGKKNFCNFCPGWSNHNSSLIVSMQLSFETMPLVFKKRIKTLLLCLKRTDLKKFFPKYLLNVVVEHIF